MSSNTGNDQVAFRFKFSSESIPQLQRLSDSPSAHKIKRLALFSLGLREMPDTGGYLNPAPGKVYHVPGEGDYEMADGDGVLPDIACLHWTRKFAPIIGSFDSLEELTLDTSPYRGMGLPFSRSLLSHVEDNEAPVLVRVEFQTYICEFFWRGFQKTKEVTFKPNPRLQGSERKAIYSDAERLSSQFEDVFEKLSMAYFDQGPSTCRFESLDMAGATIFSLCHEYLDEPFLESFNRPPLSLSLKNIRERRLFEDESDDEYDTEEEEEEEEDEGEENRPILEQLANSERVLRELSIVNCTFYKADTLLVPLFQHLKNNCSENLRTFRFEGVKDLDGTPVMFDWSGNGKLDDGSLVPEMVESMGMWGALGRMIRCVRF
ncbi:uncharacterized protein J3D65DRAFT_605850 [Phyllosticta citribraziliensis]|uniref:Uncharacterized protein n=1 Tax=Phyllosticta citribraziliensis TaxID=989973 RepID=A0ABR1LF56_9PEZI